MWHYITKYIQYWNENQISQIIFDYTCFDYFMYVLDKYKKPR